MVIFLHLVYNELRKIIPVIMYSRASLLHSVDTEHFRTIAPEY